MNTKELSVIAGGKSSLERPRYYPGLLLEDKDLTSAVDYTRDSLRLLMRSLFGCGIVCGLDVDAVFWCNKSQIKVTVHKGVAFDCEGNVIEVTEDRDLYFDPKCEALPPLLWVSIAYKERCCEQTTVACTEDDDGKTVPRRVVDGYEITVSKLAPQCSCGCVTIPKGSGAGDEHRCCKQQVAGTNDPTATNTPSSEPNLIGCDCYKTHSELACGCGCAGDCSCTGLLLAYIKIDVASEAPEVSDVKKRVPRVVRPMLLGAKCCYKRWCDEENAKYPLAGARIGYVSGADGVADARVVIESIRRQREDAAKEKERLLILRDEVKARLTKAEERERDAVRPEDQVAAARELASARSEVARHEALVSELDKKSLEIDQELAVNEKFLVLRVKERALADEQAQLKYVNERIAIAETQKLDTAALKAQRTTIAKRVKDAADALNA